jgi:hypothetical protein
MKTEYIHAGLGVSNIWESRPGKFSWANRAGEGCDLPSFEEAIKDAEEALEVAE